MDKPLIKPDEVDANLSPEARDVMAQVILTWANFDAALTQFLMMAFGASLDEGSILIGNMDTRTKLDRLKALYKHHGMAEAATSIRDLTAIHAHFVDVRNAIAHSVCCGHYLPKPGYIMFSAGRLSHGNKGLMSGTAYSLQKMCDAAEFALAASRLLTRSADLRRMRRSKPPIAPPSFVLHRDPTPQKSGKGKRGKRPQALSE